MNIRIITLLAAWLCFAMAATAQTVVFADDFESGTSNWNLTGDWGISNTQFNQGNASLSDSPGGNYLDNQTSSATMTSGADLTTALDANLTFWMIYDIEEGFDYLYIDVSDDGGLTWVTLGSFDGEGLLSPWVQYTFSLGGFVGSNDVRVRYRFVTDQGYNVDGCFIDDVEITTSNTDLAPPLILHDAPQLYECSLDDHIVNTEIVDVSGISTAELTYWVDGSTDTIVSGLNSIGNDWVFTIPAQQPGAWVDYYITATDDSDSLNTAITDTAHYIAGNYIKYDTAIVDFVNSFGPTGMSAWHGACVRFTLPGQTDMVTALIRNYTDNDSFNDSLEFHVWADNNGQPGADLITPFNISAEATLQEPHRMTRVDLRPYAADLDSLTGDVFMGFIAPVGEVWVVQSTPGTGGRTMVWDSLNNVWATITDDYHFRIITAEVTGSPQADFGINFSNDPQLTFSDSSTNSPTTWLWDFGDGTTSTVQNPNHTFTQNGTYNICLTVTNAIGSSTSCETVTISGLAAIADFTWTTANDPDFMFLDLSLNDPTSWSWDFDDGGATSTDQNPTHTFGANGTYNVCLTANNSAGGNMVCQQVVVDGYLVPNALFTYDASNSPTISFTDQSTENPVGWLWDFDEAGFTSTDQNPTHTFISDGPHNVCLWASNVVGTSDSSCQVVDINVGLSEMAFRPRIRVYPNPSSDGATISVPRGSTAMQLQAMDILGNLIEVEYTTRSEQLWVETAGLVPGTYILRISERGKVLGTTRLVVR